MYGGGGGAVCLTHASMTSTYTADPEMTPPLSAIREWRKLVVHGAVLGGRVGAYVDGHEDRVYLDFDDISMII